MSNDFIISDDLYLILLRYFDGDIININSKIIKDLKKGKFQKKEIEPVNKKIIKTLKKIIKLEETNPDEYSNITWIYPNWSEKQKNDKLKEAFPGEGDEEPIIKSETPSEPSSQIIRKTVIAQRKAFIEWINNVFYKELITIYKNRPEELSELNIYQYFVKYYLSIENPFRGLLVYHGLGTGKTATSVITAEGLSKQMRIYTFLPASLETEYIKEVKTWGDNLFKIKNNNWIFYSANEIKSDIKLRRHLKDNFLIDSSSHINIIFNKTKTKLKQGLNVDDPDYDKQISLLSKKLNDIKGIFIPSESIENEKEVYTITGEIIKETEIDRELTVNKLGKEHLIYIEEQINIMIQNKYNFIHYNGFPNVHQFDFKNNTGKILNKDKLTDNDSIVLDFAEKYKYNYENYSIESPFKNNVIVIDEVHNFVREIINGSPPALIFYNWIINSEDVKLIFLSGTPIINKPAEIAVLYNMLRGSLLIFDFIILSPIEDEEGIQNDLREYFYKENSSIEQINITKKLGKLVISFTKNKTNFESIMEDDIIKTIKYNNHTLDTFFNEIYEGLYTFFNHRDIIPSKSDLLKLSPYKDIKLGKPKTFDSEETIIFNRKQVLFEIFKDNQLFDLSDNDNFIEYFLDDQYNISPKKQVLLRRMLLGLTSYYPIDRKAIKNMPKVIKPSNTLSIYNEYSISKDINIVLCPFSPIQWSNYENEYTKEKIKRLYQLKRKNIYNDKENSSFSIRTRQSCNIVYDDDTFKEDEKDPLKKNNTYKRMISNGHFTYDKTLSLYSPKFYHILKNIKKMINEEDIPKGKVLYYSDFRHGYGSEALQEILISNGYEKYNPQDDDIESLIQKQSKKKRFTFLTGKESQDERKRNKEAFNHKTNFRGEYIQIILISSAGAEGISLKCVRQVHIMEPFWNYIRIDEVFGRAIRINSHIHPDLPIEERNVEQFLYMSSLPEGDNVEDLFRSLKKDKWPDIDDIEDGDDIKLRLLEKHKHIYKMITKLLSMKKETKNRTVDQILFDIMEKKNIISSNLINIIKESSSDCIQNTRDEIQLNNKCLRFSEKLKQEESHFPGLTLNELNKIDIKQFKSNFIYYIKPDIYVISAQKKDYGTNIFIYYKLDSSGSNDIDVRYIRENGLQLCEFDPLRSVFIYSELKEHKLDEVLGDQFSVFQSIYKLTDDFSSKMKESKFPSLKDIRKDENLIGYIIKYNINENLFYSPISKSNILRLYDIKEYQMNNYSTRNINHLFLRNKRLFKNRD